MVTLQTLLFTPEIEPKILECFTQFKGYIAWTGSPRSSKFQFTSPHETSHNLGSVTRSSGHINRSGGWLKSDWSGSWHGLLSYTHITSAGSSRGTWWTGKTGRLALAFYFQCNSCLNMLTCEDWGERSRINKVLACWRDMWMILINIYIPITPP